MWKEAPKDISDRVQDDFDRIERLAKDASRTVMRDAIGEHDLALIEQLEACESERDRALWLLVDHPDLFGRAEEALLFTAARGSSRKWDGYVGSTLSRRWDPTQVDDDALRALIIQAIKEVEHAERNVHLEWFSRPATPKGWDGPHMHQLCCSVEAPKASNDEWEGGRPVFRPVVPNRRLAVVITPHARTFEIVAEDMQTETRRALILAIAKDVVGEAGDIEPFEPRSFDLSSLVKPRVLHVHEGHGIEEVRVLKLVASAGSGGTATYWARADSSQDAWSVAAIATSETREDALFGAYILAATIRVVFVPAEGKRRKRTVTFDITMPNRCSLRDAGGPEHVILEAYLREWGLLSDYPDAEAA